MLVTTEDLNKTFEDFLNFCLTKPAEEIFDYGDPQNCAHAQFLGSVYGEYFFNIGPEDAAFFRVLGEHNSIYMVSFDYKYTNAVRCENSTFGEVADNLLNHILEV